MRQIIKFRLLVIVIVGGASVIMMAEALNIYREWSNGSGMPGMTSLSLVLLVGLVLALLAYMREQRLYFSVSEGLRRFESAAREAACGLISVNLKNVVEWVNPAFCRMCECDDEGMYVDSSVYDLFPESYHDKLTAAIRQLQHKGQWTGELEVFCGLARLSGLRRNVYSNTLVIKKIYPTSAMP